ncbi:hypothetical protein ACFLR4_03945 [Bacteroidota bacterium]
MKTLFSYFVLLLMIGLPVTNTIAQDEPDEPRQPRQFIIGERDAHRYHISEASEKEYLGKLDADLKTDFLELKEYDEERYYELLMESQYRYMEWPVVNYEEKIIYERQKEISDLEIRTELLAFKYEKASSAEKQKIKTELRAKLINLFELREKDRKYQIELLKKELEELTKSIEMRRKNKELIISRRLQEILGEDKYLDWD